MQTKKVNLNVRLNTLFNKLGLTTVAQVREYLTGRSIIPLTNNQSGQNQYPLNEPILIDKFTIFNGITSVYGMAVANGSYAGTQHVYFSECIMAPDNESALTKELKTIEEKKKELFVMEATVLEKLNFLKDTKAETVDPDAFKKYTISKVLDEKTDKETKASKILELLSQ